MSGNVRTTFWTLLNLLLSLWLSATGNADDVLTECLDESPKDELGRLFFSF